MNRIALVIAIVALVLAGITAAYALSLSNQLDDAKAGSEQMAADLVGLSNRLDDVEQAAARLGELNECMPEILDLIYSMQGSSSFGTVYVYPSRNLSRRCEGILSYQPVVGD